MDAESQEHSRRRSTFRPDSGATFPPTRWSLVVLAGDASEERRRDALRQLCEHCHEAIYAFLRRALKKSPEDALDLTNGFIAALLKVAPRIAFVPQEGRSGQPVKFRSYVCRCLKHYMIDQQRRKERVQTTETEEQFEQLCARSLTQEAEPDLVFDQVWAESVMRGVLRKLEAGPGAKEPEMFTLWAKHGPAKLPDGEFDRLAQQTGKTSGALRTHYFRLKERWGAAALQELIAAIRDTLPAATSRTVTDEVNAIRQILAGRAGPAPTAP